MPVFWKNYFPIVTCLIIAISVNRSLSYKLSYNELRREIIKSKVEKEAKDEIFDQLEVNEGPPVEMKMINQDYEQLKQLKVRFANRDLISMWDTAKKKIPATEKLEIFLNDLLIVDYDLARSGILGYDNKEYSANNLRVLDTLEEYNLLDKFISLKNPKKSKLIKTEL